MAKDDYFVIVYQILSYLYQRLKRGESVDARMISAESDLYTIPRSYWALYYGKPRWGEDFNGAEKSCMSMERPRCLA